MQRASRDDIEATGSVDAVTSLPVCSYGGIAKLGMYLVSLRNSYSMFSEVIRIQMRGC